MEKVRQSFLHVCTMLLCIGWSSALLAQTPSNDACTNATALNVQLLNACGGATPVFTTGTNVGATPFSATPAIPGQPNPTCASYAGGDVWYSFVMPSTSVTLVTQGSAGSAITDLGAAAYIGTCSGLTQLVCDDDSGAGLFSQFTVTTAQAAAGTVVFVGIWEFGNN